MKGRTAIVWAVVLLGSVWLPVRGQTAKEDYMSFLYQYLSLPDKADYTRDFYEQNVGMALMARDEMPWGRTVPEREFRHFVLPVRVNNETLDSSRVEFYRELKPRVEHLSMEDAILEVNHWCHEHVTYRPSDARTSSPLATIRTAYGRCGEESTLLVAALRSVGIPARQVYTPRWAHTDDNHAWVEAWADDGEWHFVGACEPEPVLDLGWFNESASRGMLMHTKVFGDYSGPEEVMSRTPCYTEINVIDHYAPASKVTVRVVDTKGRPVNGAQVDFCIYNYAEFYPVARKTTGSDGRVSLTAGKGDLLAWVSRNGEACIQKISFDEEKEVKVVLDRHLPSAISSLQAFDLDMVPPQASVRLPDVTAGQRAENNRRLAEEDSLRRLYESTMPVDDWRGNHATIRQFLDEAKNPVMARKLLEALSKKDLRDVELAVLKDNEVALTDTSELYLKYVLCPRVENEWLTPYKAFFRREMAGLKSARDLENWCSRHIRIDNGHNPQQLRMQPMSVYRERVSDELGRNIFFVSVARSLGMPARIHEVTGKPQYYAGGVWHEAFVQGAGNGPQRQVSGVNCRFSYQAIAHFDDPRYYTHFTVSRLVDGKPELLTYPEETTWRNGFAKGQLLEPGEYLLTTGVRMSHGKVRARLQRFSLQRDTVVPLILRESSEEVQVIGSLNAENIYHDHAEQADKTLLSTTGRGYYVLAVVAPNHEPTNHVLRDISVYQEEFERWGGKLVMLFRNEDEVKGFHAAEFGQLPANVVWGTDAGGRILKEISEQLHLTGSSLPVILICDSFNRVVFCQQGYTINIGEQLLKVIRQL